VGWIKVGLDSFVDPDNATVSRSDRHKPRDISCFGYLEYQGRDRRLRLGKAELHFLYLQNSNCEWVQKESRGKKS
jgi:hypothetical protein